MSDPVLERRERLRRLAEAAQRAGWVCVLVAVVAFFVGLATDLGRWGPVVVVALAACTLTLAPGILLGYAVRAAERDERDGRGGHGGGGGVSRRRPG